jgi:phosphoesterase RecJ-like protein
VTDLRGDYCFLPGLTLDEALAGAGRVVLTAHVDPDPDALGCVLAVHHALRRAGWATVPVCIGRVASFVRDLPGREDLVVFPSRFSPDDPPAAVLASGDALVVFDTPTPGRMAGFYAAHQKTMAGTVVVNVDHHVTNERFGTHNFVDVHAAATAEVVMDILDASDIQIDAAAAQCLMAALVADTQAFRTENTSPRSLTLAHRLWHEGGDLPGLAQSILSSRPVAALKLWGAALEAMRREGSVVWAPITAEMLDRAGATLEDAEGLVDLLLSAQEAEVAMVIREEPGETKVSVRTVPGVDATAIVRSFGGGGHSRAAGCSLFVPAAEAADELMPLALAETQASSRR